MRWAEVTALFGGTFDPPHVGHRQAVQALLTHPGVRAVRVLPSPTPPHKPTMVGAEARLDMARLAFAGIPLVSVDDRELQRAQTSGGKPTYTYDTLMELRPELGALAFVIGTDQLAALPTWHRFAEVLGLCHWIVLERRGDIEQAWRKTLGQLEAGGLLRSGGGGAYRIARGGTTLQLFNTPAQAISSTRIRERLAVDGRPPEGSLVPEVEAYLIEHRLYGTGAVK